MSVLVELRFNLLGLSANLQKMEEALRNPGGADHYSQDLPRCMSSADEYLELLVAQLPDVQETVAGVLYQEIYANVMLAQECLGELQEQVYYFRYQTGSDSEERMALYPIEGDTYAHILRPATGPLMLLTHKLAAVAEATPDVPDGPHGDDGPSFFHKQTEYRLPTTSARLMRLLWPTLETKRPVEFLKICDTIWLDDCTPTATVKSAIYRLNEWFKKNRLPYKATIASETAYLELP